MSLRRGGRIALSAAVALRLAVVVPAAAASTSVTGTLELAGKYVPLPVGSWSIAAVGVQQPGAPGAQFGVARYVILVLHEGARVRALLEVSANDIPVRSGWDAPCGHDGDDSQRRVRYQTRYDASCAEAGATHLNEAGPPAWRDARAAMLRNGLALPEQMLTATALSADRQDFLQVRLHVGPLPGMAAPAQQAMLLDWATRYAAVLELGLSRRLPGVRLELPGRSAVLQESPVVERHLLEVEALRRAGTLTAGEAVAQQQAIVAELPLGAENPNVSRSLWNRLSSPLINLATAWSVTRSAQLALAIAASEQVAREAIGVANEARWRAVAREMLPEPSPLPALPRLGTPVEPVS